MDNVEISLVRALREEAESVEREMLEKSPASLNGNNRARAKLRRSAWQLGLAAVAAVLVLLAGLQLRPDDSKTPPTAQTSKPSVPARIGPGCPIGGLALTNTGTETDSAGRPVLVTKVSEAVTLQGNIEAGPAGLVVDTTLLVAQPGTVPGRGFIQPSEAEGKPSLDDRNNWLASVQTTDSKVQDLTLTFAPTGPGEYPIYAIQSAKPITESPGFCGGVPLTGGLAENIVGWVRAD
jgi:hypothetical protein